MSWLKDNLLFCLAGLCALLGVTLLVTVLVYKVKLSNQQTKYTALEGSYNTLVDTNKANVANVTDVTNKYNTLVNKRRLELVAADEKAKEFEKLKTASQQALTENRALRARLAQADPDVKEYLEAGIPHALACQLWPAARECKDPVRRP